MSDEPAGMVYPSGLEVTYSRDASGRISGIAVDGQPLLQNITYNPFGPIANYRIANSLLTVDRTYDLLYRLEHAHVGPLYDLSYDSDAAGQVFAINDLLNPSSGQSFVYDSLDRLTSADGIYGSIGYSYDAAGNRQTRTSGTDTDSYTYVAGSNRLAAITGSNPAIYTYDDHGNMIGNGVFTFAYDQANRLSEVWNGEVLVAEYHYDGRNLRVKKDANGMVTYYHYEPQGKLIAETDGSGSPLRDYIYLGDEPVAVKVHGAQAGIYYYINDHLGTPQRLIDSAGMPVWQASYDPFGQAVVDPASTVENNLRLPGQYYDEETGLHYNWHRFYDPNVGRYLTPDPIGLAGGLNLYSYVLNNPVNFIDPLGLATYYGNWGGPNWTGRYRKSWDQLSPEHQRRALSDPSRVPIDKQDVCYMHHDICYGNSRTKCADEPCPRDCEKKAFNKCDDELAGCLVNCGIMSNAADEIRRDLAIPTFVIQPAYRNRGYSDTSSESQSYYQFRFNF